MPVCPLPNRAVVRVTGQDARALLQALLTQDLRQLSAARPLYAALLSAQGKTLFPLFLFDAGTDVLVDVERSDRDSFIGLLHFYRLSRKADATAEPGLQPVVCWDEPDTAAMPDDPRTALAGQRFLAPAEPAGRADPLSDCSLWHARRLPLGLAEADEIGRGDLMWLEANGRELNGVSFRKGCYVGQENTARMHFKDRLRRRLLPLRLSGPAAADAMVMANGIEAGRLRGARHGELQMALLKLQFLDAGLSVAGAPASLVRPPWLAA